MIALAQADSFRIPLKDESVHVIVTSPPYFSLRRYSGDQSRVWGGSIGCQHMWGNEQSAHHPGQVPDSKWQSNPDLTKGQTASRGQFCQLCGAWKGALGLEPDPFLYAQHIVEICREIRRALRSDGTFWLNLGSSYWGGKGRSGSQGAEFQQMRCETGVSFSSPAAHVGGRGKTRPSDGNHPVFKPKDLVPIPWMVALALQHDGWWLRDAIIWIKAEVNTDEIPMFDMPIENVLEGSAMPGSQKDRCTSSYEFIFHLAKSRVYYFDQEAEKTTSGATLRNTWRMNPQNYKGAHFATFCEELPRRCIKLGTSEHGCCPVCGTGWKRVVERKGMTSREWQAVRGTGTKGYDSLMGQQGKSIAGGRPPDPIRYTVGWRPSCDCYSKPMMCPDCAGTGAQIVCTGLPEHGSLEQESCDRCGGTGTIVYGAPQRGPVKCERCEGTGKERATHVGKTETAYPTGSTANRMSLLRQAARESGAEYNRAFTGIETGEPCPHCLCPDCEGTGHKLAYPRGSEPYRAEQLPNRKDKHALKRDHDGRNFAGKVPTDEICPTCNGVGALGYVDGDVWPDDVEDWPTVPAIVLDPFAGSCTTGIACQKLGRDFIGLDLSLSYLRDQARKRLSLDMLDAWHDGDARDGGGESLDELPLFGGVPWETE